MIWGIDVFEDFKEEFVRKTVDVGHSFCLVGRTRVLVGLIFQATFQFPTEPLKFGAPELQNSDSMLTYNIIERVCITDAKSYRSSRLLA